LQSSWPQVRIIPSPPRPACAQPRQSADGPGKEYRPPQRYPRPKGRYDTMCHFSRPLPAQSSVRGIRNYDDFCHANDPYEEHDFGSFEADGHKIFFKIDYYDSPDPSDPAVTNRVITIMLAEEY
jgi:hypothetical protein